MNIMNKRIEELAPQCWEERKLEPSWFDYEKFAKMIVKDCAEQALKKGMASPDTDFRTGSFVISEYLLSRYDVE